MHGAPMMVPATGDINLKDSWDTLWTSVTQGFGKAPQIMTVIGLIVLVFALAKYFWDRRKNGSANAHPVWSAIIVGGILAAPQVVFPVLLFVADGLANIGLALFQNATGSH